MRHERPGLVSTNQERFHHNPMKEQFYPGNNLTLTIKYVIFTSNFLSMNIHEYQGKEILKSFGVRVQEGIVAETPEQAVDAAKKLKEDLNSRSEERRVGKESRSRWEAVQE